MALSDQLYALAGRAKEAEDKGAAAKNKASAQLQRTSMPRTGRRAKQDVDAADRQARSHADQLNTKMDQGKGKVSDWWEDQQKNWNKGITKAREHMSEKKAEHDLNSAQKQADNAEKDASFAIEYAYAAIDEAEYEVLDAILLRKQADEMAGSTKM